MPRNTTSNMFAPSVTLIQRWCAMVVLFAMQLYTLANMIRHAFNNYENMQSLLYPLSPKSLHPVRMRGFGS